MEKPSNTGNTMKKILLMLIIGVLITACTQEYEVQTGSDAALPTPSEQPVATPQPTTPVVTEKVSEDLFADNLDGAIKDLEELAK
jgi:hypothetical protein